MDPLFAPLFGATAVSTATDGRAWLGALCEVETALARACARAGLIDTVTALEIAAVAAELGRGDPADLGRAAVAGGNPVIPLVTRLRRGVAERVDDDAAAAVHLGATSQDILDTAMMLVAQRATGVVLAGLRDCADAAAALAREHRATPMAGRTLLQQAVPTTFGALAAVWGAGLDRAGTSLAAARDGLAVQLGGAAGTLAPLHPHGPAVRAALADELGLADPHGVWHTERTRIAELAGALGGIAVAAIGKVAGDLVLLAQTEIGEVHEAAPGGSSAMAHKQNPIAAVTARAGAARAPGPGRHPAGRRPAGTAARGRAVARRMAGAHRPADRRGRRDFAPRRRAARPADRPGGDAAQSRDAGRVRRHRRSRPRRRPGRRLPRRGERSEPGLPHRRPRGRAAARAAELPRDDDRDVGPVHGRAGRALPRRADRHPRARRVGPAAAVGRRHRRRPRPRRPRRVRRPRARPGRHRRGVGRRHDRPVAGRARSRTGRPAGRDLHLGRAARPRHLPRPGGRRAQRGHLGRAGLGRPLAHARPARARTPALRHVARDAQRRRRRELRRVLRGDRVLRPDRRTWAGSPRRRWSSPGTRTRRCRPSTGS